MQSNKEPHDITNNILTNQSDHKNTWGSERSRPGTLDIHEGHAADGNNYAYSTPNCHEPGNQDNPQHHGTYPLQQLPTPSKKPPVPLPYPDPSEASERSSPLLVSPSLLPEKVSRIHLLTSKISHICQEIRDIKEARKPKSNLLRPNYTNTSLDEGRKGQKNIQEPNNSSFAMEDNNDGDGLGDTYSSCSKQCHPEPVTNTNSYFKDNSNMPRHL